MGRAAGAGVNELALFAGAAMKTCKRCDASLPEQAFYMVGTIDEAIEKAKKIQ